MRDYKLRSYPNKVVETELNGQLDLCRWTYNKLLEELNKAKEGGKKLKRNATQELPQRAFRFSYYNKIESNIDHDSSRNILTRALSNIEESASMLAESGPIILRKRIQTLKREATCGSSG